MFRLLINVQGRGYYFSIGRFWGLRQVQVEVISYVLGGGDDDCIKLRFFG
jgi:hypothetical protein